MVKRETEVERLTEDISKRLKPASEKRAPVAARRFSVASKPVVHREVVIVKGKGKRLGDIPYVANLLEKKKARDPMVVATHLVIYGTKANHLKAKGNLREFNGVVYDANFDRHKLEGRLEKRTVLQLRAICTLLGLERGGGRAELQKRIADFLEKPRETDAAAPASPKKKKAAAAPKRKKASGTTKKAAKSAPRKKKAKAAGPKRPLSAYMHFAIETRGELAKKHPGEGVTEIAKRLGEMWKKLKDKSVFEAKAAKDKARYERELKAAK